MLLNYDDQVAKDASLIGICKSQEEYDTLCSAYRIPFALLSVNLADAGRYYAALPFEELTAISQSFEVAADVKLSSQTDILHIGTDKLLRMYIDRKLGWDKDITISEQVQAEIISNASPYCYELAQEMAKSQHKNKLRNLYLMECMKMDSLERCVKIEISREWILTFVGDFFLFLGVFKLFITFLLRDLAISFSL